MSFSSALQPGVRPRELFAWAMYDFANSGFTTVVITAVSVTTIYLVFSVFLEVPLPAGVLGIGG